MPTFSQIKFEAGIQFGITFSQFPKNNPFTDTSEDVNEKLNPLLGPLIGVQGKLLKQSPFEFTAALQYQLAGTRYHYNRDSNFAYNHWQKQTFHKLCLPLALAYSFKIFKVPSSIFVGYRFNYLITASHNDKIVYERINGLSEGDYEFNPLDPKQTTITMSRFQRQISIGYTILLGKKFELTFSFNKGEKVYYTPEVTDPDGHSTVKLSYQNTDWIIGMNYLLGK